MGGPERMKKKGAAGSASKYITRARALAKLQLSLQQFRKLCILKGVYPRDPKKKRRGNDKTYFHVRDISYLATDPLVEQFRAQTAHARKIVKAEAKNEPLRAKKLRRAMPQYRLDVVVRERYPSFHDMLRDLDDALCMVHIFANHPATGRLKPQRIALCERLCREFQAYCVRAGALRKVFVSIKGIYYQAEVAGYRITWLAPHKFVQPVAADVDYRVMATFLELHETMLGFALYKLYTDVGQVYPPTPNKRLLEADDPLGALLTPPDDDTAADDDASESDDDDDDDDDDSNADADDDKEAAQLRSLDVRAIARKEAEHEARSMAEAGAGAAAGEQDAGPSEFAPLALDAATREETHRLTREDAAGASLFSELKVYLAREVSRDACEFALRAFGARVSWPDGPFAEDDAEITHHIVDRALDDTAARLGRNYVQPQWIFDSINFGALMPIADYAPDATLPPHLSPFVDDKREGYVPAYKQRLDALLQRAHEHRAALEAAGQVAMGKALSLDAVAADADAEAAQAGAAKPSQAELDAAEAELDDDELEQRYQRELEAEKRGVSYQKFQRGDESESESESGESDASGSDDGAVATAKQAKTSSKKRKARAARERSSARKASKTKSGAKRPTSEVPKKYARIAKMLGKDEEDGMAAIMMNKKQKAITRKMLMQRDRSAKRIGALERKRDAIERQKKRK